MMPRKLMSHNRMQLALLLVLLFIGLQANEAAQAAPHATYAWVQNASVPGGRGSAGIYDLSSSIGQPAAGEVSAGIYTFGGGFWGGGVIVPVQNHFEVFLPLVRR